MGLGKARTPLPPNEEPSRPPSVPDGLVIGPAGGLTEVRFDSFSPKSLEAYVGAVVQHGFGCFGLPTDRAPWLAPAQQEHLKRLIANVGLRGWHTGGGHALDADIFSQPAPRWNAALAFHRERIKVARASGLEGIIASPPPDAAGSQDQAEDHLRELVEQSGGGLWIANSANPARRTGTASALADLCRATGAHPCYNAPAHLHRAKAPSIVDEHKTALRDLGERVVIRYGNLVVVGGEANFTAYAGQHVENPIDPVVLALKELGRLATPILVEGHNAKNDTLAVRADARRALGMDASIAG